MRRFRWRRVLNLKHSCRFDLSDLCRFTSLLTTDALRRRETGGIEFQDDGVVGLSLDSDKGGHGIGEEKSYSEKKRFDVVPRNLHS